MSIKDSDFACKCCGHEIVDEKLADILYDIESEYPSIVIHCVYRCSRHNKIVGGEKNSKHLCGSASDFHIPGKTIDEMYDIAFNYNDVGGIGLYNSWIHIDVRPKKEDGSIAFWDKRS